MHQLHILVALAPITLIVVRRHLANLSTLQWLETTRLLQLPRRARQRSIRGPAHRSRYN